jgi:nitrate reductase NapAB chaperone NapD
MSILGVIVRTRPEDESDLQRHLLALPGVDIAAAAGGRFVVVIEDSAASPAAATMAQLAQLPRVLNTSLVYEYSGPDSPGPAEHADDFQAWRRSLAERALPQS